MPHTNPFDAYADRYDAWFLENRNILASEVLLLRHFLSTQTLTTHPRFANDAVEQPSAGFDRGGYVAILASRQPAEVR